MSHFPLVWDIDQKHRLYREGSVLCCGNPRPRGRYIDGWRKYIFCFFFVLYLLHTRYVVRFVGFLIRNHYPYLME